MSRMIPDEIVDQVRRASDIVEVIQSYIPLKRAGASWKALSPFQKEKTPSFTVSPSRQMFKCFSSNYAGDVFKFVQLYESVDFPTAVRKLADRAGIPIPEGPDDGGAARNLRQALLDVHNVVASWWAKLLHSNSMAKPGRDYLSSRAMGSALAKEWGLGYAPESWEGTLQYVRKKGFKEDAIAECGLFIKKEETGRLYDRFRGRLMFPICDDSGQVIGFSGRELNANPEMKGAKYINSPATPLFNKGHIFFGLHKTKRAIIEKKQAVLCEGQIDLIRCWEHGIRNVVAPQGTGFTDTQGRMLKRLANEVIICFDADRAGLKASERSVEILLEHDLTIRIARMPAGEDPDSLLRKGGAAAMEGVLASARDFIDHLLEVVCTENDVATPRGKMAAVERMAGIVRRIQNPIMQDAVRHKVAGRLKVTSEMLEKEMEKQKSAPRYADTATDADLQETGGGDLGMQLTPLPPFRCDARIRDLLSLLLPNPQLVPGIQRELNMMWLEGLEGAGLVQDFLSAHADDAFEDIAQFASGLPEQEQSFVGELAVNPVPLEKNAGGGKHGIETEKIEPKDYETYAKVLLSRLEERYLRMRKSILEQEIKANQLQIEQLNGRLKELNQVMEALRKFGRLGA